MLYKLSYDGEAPRVNDSLQKLSMNGWRIEAKKGSLDKYYLNPLTSQIIICLTKFQQLIGWKHVTLSQTAQKVEIEYKVDDCVFNCPYI